MSYADTATQAAPPSQDLTTAPDTITLKVTGNGSQSSTITYSEGTSIEQATNARIPWQKTITDAGGFYQVSAQDDDGTSITCEIDSSVLGVLDKHTSTGQYAIASCNAQGVG